MQHELFVILQSVDLGIMAAVLQLLRVHVDAEAEAAFPAELDQIASNATKTIEDSRLP